VTDSRVAHYWLDRALATGRMEPVRFLLDCGDWGGRLVGEFSVLPDITANLAEGPTMVVLGPNLSNLLLLLHNTLDTALDTALYTRAAYFTLGHREPSPAQMMHTAQCKGQIGCNRIQGFSITARNQFPQKLYIAGIQSWVKNKHPCTPLSGIVFNRLKTALLWPPCTS
jgi:hypothetical protein